MITGYIEYCTKRETVRKDLKAKKISKNTVKTARELEEFETKYPDSYKRYEKEQAKSC